MRAQLKILLFLLTLGTASAFSYELQFSEKAGRPVLRWQANSLTISLSASLSEGAPNLRNSTDVISIARAAAGQWEAVADVRFDFTDSKELSVSPPGERGDGISLLTIAATPQNVLLFSGENAGSAAITRLFYDDLGRITEADIVLNPVFLTSTDGTPGSFDLESTLVHEFGHALGLGHSQVLGATMNDRNGRNGLYALPFTLFRTVSEDDASAARSLYGARKEDFECCGRITGVIESAENFAGDVYLVWAEEAASGRVAAAVETDFDGAYSLLGLRAGTYRIYAKPMSFSGSVSEVGDVRVTRGDSSKLKAKISPDSIPFRVSFTGFNGQLSSVAVPVNSGDTYMVYVGGIGLGEDSRVGFSSPHVVIDEETVTSYDYGNGIAVLAFAVDVNPDTPLGEYTIWIYDGDGLMDCLPGAVTVETQRNPWILRHLQ